MRRRKIEEAKRAEASGFKVEQHEDTIATDATTSSLAKKTRGFSAINTDRACSNRRGRINECGDSIPESVSKVCASELICDGCR